MNDLDVEFMKSLKYLNFCKIYFKDKAKMALHNI